MRIHLITNNKEMALGIRFSGISYEIVNDDITLKCALDKAIKNSDIGIILITASAVNYCREHIIKLKIVSRRRIIMEIPDILNEDFLNYFQQQSNLGGENIAGKN